MNMSSQEIPWSIQNEKPSALQSLQDKSNFISKSKNQEAN